MFRKATLPLALCTLGLLLVSAAPASAQAKKGSSEILLFGNISMNPKDASNSGTGTFFFNYGVFVSDHTQLGAGPLITVTSSQLSGTSSTLGLNAFVRQYFGGARVQPYVGGEVFMGDVENSDSTFLNIIGGVKNYFSDRAALDFKLGYGFQSQAPAFGERAQMLQFSIGLTVLF